MSWPVGVRSVFDSYDRNYPLGIVDAVNDSVVASARAVETFEVQLEGFADAVGIVCYRAVQEFDRRRADLLRYAP